MFLGKTNMVDFRKKLSEKRARKSASEKAKADGKMSIFRIIDAICETKDDITSDPLFEKSYNPFLINRWLSMHKRTVWAAFFADQVRGMTKQQHFRFVSALIEPERTRITYKKFPSPDAKSVKIVQEYFQIGQEQSIQIVNILNPKQIKLLRESFGDKMPK